MSCSFCASDTRNTEEALASSNAYSREVAPETSRWARETEAVRREPRPAWILRSVDEGPLAILGPRDNAPLLGAGEGDRTRPPLDQRTAFILGHVLAMRSTPVLVLHLGTSEIGTREGKEGKKKSRAAAEGKKKKKNAKEETCAASRGLRFVAMVVQTRKRRRPTAKVDSAAQGEEIEGDGAPRGETAGGAGVPEALALVEGTAPQAEGTPPQAEGTPPEPEPEPRPEDDANYSEKAHMKFLELWRSALPHFQGTEEQRAMISDEEHLYKLSLEVTIALGKEYTPPKNTNDKVRKQLTKQYMKRLRSFNHNFNIENNPDLTFEVLLGDITPEQLCTMDPSEYAPKDLREENARLREESMKRRVLDAETAATFSTAAAVTAAVENKVEVLGKSNVTKDEVLDLEMKVERKISASKEEGEERLDAMADELFNASPKRARASPPAKSSRQPSPPRRPSNGNPPPLPGAGIPSLPRTPTSRRS